MDETEPSPADPPLGAERYHMLDPYEKETALTRRFYLLLLGLIVLASLIATIIVALDNDTQVGTIAAVLVIGGVATGALASLATHDRR